ncbi:MAG: SpoIID/LytB domain-containing protein [Actinomycetes bacterium]
MRRPLPLALSVGLVLSVASAVGVQGAVPAAAADCPASGGAALTRVGASGDVVFRGGGWGHGLGMSQYGAQGAARLGCTYEQILRRYYTGTEVRTAAMPDLVRLRMLDGGYRVDVTAHDGPLAWVLEDCTGPTPENPAAAVCPPVQPQGASWQLRVDATTSQYVLYDLGVTPKAVVWQGGTPSQVLRLDQTGTVARVTTWKGSSIYLDRWLRWDRTKFSLTGGALDAVQHIEPSPVGSAMDKYLWGIAEVPASFPGEALKAQAIAARTYAAKRAGRVLHPTPADQNYTGWKKETEGPDGAWGARWMHAVDATSREVVAMAGGGPLIDAFYSSSMGGHTEDERYVWGVEAPFLRAVDDSRWDLASTNPAEKRSWAVAFSWAKVAKRLGFDQVSTISVAKRGSDRRLAGVKVRGVRNGALTTSYVEGWDVREALGLLSPGFTIRFTKLGGRTAQPLTGDWNGDGTDEPGWFRAGSFSLAMSSNGSPWTKRFRYGQAGDVAVVGDWDRDGDDDIGVFRGGTWLLRADLSAGEPTATLTFGAPGDTPVVGSWNGRTTGIGVVRGNRWLLRHTATTGPSQRSFHYGRVADNPLVGSWNGSGRSAIGVERDGTWLLRNRRSAGRAGIRLEFGRASDRALAGDWDGDGRTTVGVVRRTTFRLRATLAEDSAAPPRVFVG